MGFPSLVLGLLSFAVCLSSTSAEDRESLRKSFLAKSPPEIVSEKEHWLGSRAPATLGALKGKVVWLQFNF